MAHQLFLIGSALDGARQGMADISVVRVRQMKLGGHHGITNDFNWITTFAHLQQL
ncbi:unnamed protein product [Absidia cylindrospora]